MSFFSFHFNHTSKWMHHTVSCCCWCYRAFNVIIFNRWGGGLVLVRKRWYCWWCFTLILGSSNSVNIWIWQMLWLYCCGWWFLSWIVVINHSSCLVQLFLLDTIRISIFLMFFTYRTWWNMEYGWISLYTCSPASALQIVFGFSI